MNSKLDVKPESKYIDFMKWFSVVLLISVAVVGNSLFSSEPLIYRVLGVVVLAAVSAFVAIKTIKGRQFFKMLVEAKTEIKKVVWPSRQETIQTTLIVVVVVLIMSLVLWGLDSFLGWILSFVIG